jgi:hypothetical protein
MAETLQKRPRATRQEIEAVSRQILLHWSQGVPDHEIKDRLGINDSRWKSCVGYIAKTGGISDGPCQLFVKLALRQEAIRRHALGCYERFHESPATAAIAIGCLQTALECDRVIVEMAEKLGVFEGAASDNRGSGFKFIFPKERKKD